MPPLTGRRATTRSAVDLHLGVHPSVSEPLGRYLVHKDELTSSSVPHRALTENPANRIDVLPHLKEALTRHHASSEQQERTRQIREVMVRQNIPLPPGLRRFPTAEKTRKGNFAEVVLAEYITATSSFELPVYRLRYNTNVEQSMKGDDVLAFDLDADPVRILVGEAKFRETPTQAAVSEIVTGLLRSFRGDIPISLQFVADRLYEEQRPDLGRRVSECAIRFAEGRLQLGYVGLLLSNERASEFVPTNVPEDMRNLVMLSIGVPNPSGLVDDCFAGLE